MEEQKKEVTLKRKVALKRKVVSGEETHERIAASASTPHKKAGHKGLIWGVACAAAVVILLLVVMRPQSDNSVPEQPAAAETTPQTSEPTKVPAENATANDNAEAVPEAATAAETDKMVDKVEDNVNTREAEAATSKAAETSNAAPATSGSVEQQVQRVLRGDLGDGQERRLKLGDQYEAVQAKINEMYRNGLLP